MNSTARTFLYDAARPATKHLHVVGRELDVGLADDKGLWHLLAAGLAHVRDDARVGDGFVLEQQSLELRRAMFSPLLDELLRCGRRHRSSRHYRRGRCRRCAAAVAVDRRRRRVGTVQVAATAARASDAHRPRPPPPPRPSSRRRRRGAPCSQVPPTSGPIDAARLAAPPSSIQLLIALNSVMPYACFTTQLSRAACLSGGVLAERRRARHDRADARGRRTRRRVDLREQHRDGRRDVHERDAVGLRAFRKAPSSNRGSSATVAPWRGAYDKKAHVP